MVSSDIAISIMTTNTQLGVIAHLINQEEPQTIRGIARALDKSYPLVYKAIQELVKEKILIMKNAPPAKIISVNPYAPSWVMIEAEKKRSSDFLQKYKEAKILLDDILGSVRTAYFTLLVFGGYAKGQETAKSDLDLLMIVPTKANIQKMEDALAYVPGKIKKHLIIVDEEDFISMLSKANQFNVGNEARKHHLILYGVEQYCKLVRRSRE